LTEIASGSENFHKFNWFVEVEVTELRTAVVAVLQSARHGKQTDPTWVTAYQVLSRLDPELRATLVNEHGGYGGRANDADRGTGAANAVMRVLKTLRDERLVEVDYLDAASDASFSVGEGTWVQPGNVTCALYKWVG